MQITTEYKNEQLKRLLSLPIGKVVSLDVAAKDYKQKVAAIKTIIDWGQDKDNGIDVTFNNDYTKIKVLNLNSLRC